MFDNKQYKKVNNVINLLSNENLTLEFVNTNNASIDLENRILFCPNFSISNEAILNLFISHEVGHAFFTDKKMYYSTINENKNMSSYCNVIEDVYIEKAIQKKYPGMKKVFRDGRKEIIREGYVNVKNNHNNFIDKINIFFKYGISFHFNDKENEFISRIQKIESTFDSMKLAKEIYDYELKKYNDIKNNELKIDKFDNEEFDDDENTISIKMNGDDNFDRKDYSGYKDPEEFDDDEEEKKEENIDLTFESDNNIKSDQLPSELSESNTLENELKIENDKVILNKKVNTIRFQYEDSKIIDYKNSFFDTLLNYEEVNSSKYQIIKERLKKYQDLKKEIENDSKHMVFNFYRKKEGLVHRNSYNKKSGIIDCENLAKYKTDENIFKIETKKRKGKNHGCYILVDFSQSMNLNYYSFFTYLAKKIHFLRKANIPFKIVFFTFINPSGYFDGLSNEIKESLNSKKMNYGSKFVENWLEKNKKHNLSVSHFMMELFNSEMTNREFKKIMGILISSIVERNSFYYPHNSKSLSSYMGGTPLNLSLIVATNQIHKMKKEKNIDIMNFYLFSDGEDNLFSRDVDYVIDDTKGKIFDKENDNITNVLMNRISELYVNHLFVIDIVSKNEKLYQSTFLKLFVKSKSYFISKFSFSEYGINENLASDFQKEKYVYLNKNKNVKNQENCNYEIFIINRDFFVNNKDDEFEKLDISQYKTKRPILNKWKKMFTKNSTKILDKKIIDIFVSY